MASTFSLNGRIGLTVSDLVSNAKKAETAVDDVADAIDDVDKKSPSPSIKVTDKVTPALDDIEAKFGDIPDAAADAGDQASTNLADGFEDLINGGGALIGGAVATGIVTAFNTGMDRIQARTRIEQEFGLIEADAERYGQEAGDIYAAGWGDSSAEVLASLALIDRKLVETGEISDSEAQGMAEGAQVVADVFGKDVSEVIEAVSDLLLNDLAPDATSALDIVAAAMQDGADGAGDLFESIDEYSQHFDDMGLSATDMMTLFVKGLENGQRDTDKLADAVKEMRIRAVESGETMDQVYHDLGLNADEYREKILAGGPAAREAFNEIIDALSAVEDPVEQNRLAVEMMGTQYEDLGDDALLIFQAMGEGLGNVTGKVDEMNTAMTGSQSQWDLLSRDIKSSLGEMAEGFATIANTDLGGALIESIWDTQAISDYGKELMGTNELAGDFVMTLEQEKAMLGQSAEASAEAEKQARDLGKEMVTAARGTEDAVDASEDHTEAMEEEAEAAAELAEKVDELTGKKTELVGGTIEVDDAMQDARDAVAELDEAMAESTLTDAERASQLRDTISAQLNAAQKSAEYRAELLEADGAVLSNRDKNLLLRDELALVAGTLAEGSMLREAVDGYVADLDKIEDDYSSEIKADTVQATLDVDEFKRRVNGLTDKTVTITTRNVTIGVQSNAGRGGGVQAAGGGQVDKGVTALVGEDGPEIVTFDRDAFVHTASNSATIAGRGPDPFAAANSVGVSAPYTHTSGQSSATGVVTGDTNVMVMIGTTELTDIIDTRIERNEQQKELVS